MWSKEYLKTKAKTRPKIAAFIVVRDLLVYVLNRHFLTHHTIWGALNCNVLILLMRILKFCKICPECLFLRHWATQVPFWMGPSNYIGFVKKINHLALKYWSSRYQMNCFVSHLQLENPIRHKTMPVFREKIQNGSSNFQVRILLLHKPNTWSYKMNFHLLIWSLENQINAFEKLLHNVAKY